MVDVTNQSGGIDINSLNTTIGQDAVGRDKIVNTTVNNYFAYIDPAHAVSISGAPSPDSDDGNRGRLESIGNLVLDYFDHLEQIFERQGAPFGLPTGFYDLDRLMGGFQRSDLIVMAARSGIGKTSFLLSVALNAAHRFHQRIAVFSLSASNRQIAQRLLSILSGIDSQRLRLGALDEEDWNTFSEAARLLSELSIYIDDTPNLSVLQLRNKSLQLHTEHGLDAILVDGLQLLTCEPPYVANEQYTSSVMRALKALAREANVPVIVTSEVNQSVDRRIDKRPVLKDFDDPLAVERYADAVLFVYRDDLYDSDSVRKNVAEIIVARNQQGPTGTIELFFQRNLGLFRNVLKRDAALHD